MRRLATALGMSIAACVAVVGFAAAPAHATYPGWPAQTPPCPQGVALVPVTVYWFGVPVTSWVCPVPVQHH